MVIRVFFLLLVFLQGSGCMSQNPAMSVEQLQFDVPVLTNRGYNPVLRLKITVPAEQYANVEEVKVDLTGTTHLSGQLVLITSRNENAFKRFTLTGEYVNTIHVPGSCACRPVIHKENLYAAVFRSISNENVGSGYILYVPQWNSYGGYPIKLERI